MEKQTQHLEFAGDESISVQALERYLRYFCIVYCSLEKGCEHFEASLSDIGSIQSIWEALPRETVYEAIRRLYWFPLGIPFDFCEEEELFKERSVLEDLQILSISKNSPLKITLCGIGIALTCAVILSGGSIDFSLKGISCKLPPIGEGIEALRKAIRKKF